MIIQRKALRQHLGVNRLHTVTLGTAQLTVGVGSAVNVFDPAYGNTDYSGQQLYQNAWIRAGSADYRVGSFNVGSGAWVSAQLVRGAAIPSGGDVEIWQKISPSDADRYIDEAILQLRVRREVGILTASDANFYAVDTAASPHTIKAVLNAYVFGTPSGATDRQRHDLTQEQIVTTATGTEIRLPHGLAGSQQLVLDAILQLSLGASDTATLNLGPLYDEEAILWGAAARVYDALMHDSPGQEFGNYEKLNLRAVKQSNRLVRKGMPQIDAKIGFDSPFEQTRESGPLDDWR